MVVTTEYSNTDLAAAILELTILDAGAVMNRVGEMFLDLARSVEEASQLLESDGCGAERAEKIAAIRSKVGEIVIELQWNDTSDQRLSHVLSFLRDPKADCSILSEASEQKLASLMDLGMSPADAISTIQHNSPSDVELF